jgi:flagellar M-ring protein FliF
LQQITTIWSTLSARRRVIVIAATLAMFAAVLGLSRMASQPTMALLYAGLESGAAGDVVTALEQQNVAYDVRDGAIFVEASKRDALRMTLAATGLPADNGQGYELLDQLSGFGTTSQMFDATYWRAKEGELARTIKAGPQIKGARVHISNPSSNPFRRDQKPTASVTLITTSGTLGGAQAKALKFLVASAVAGLAPEDVTVIDGRSGTVLQADDAAQGSTGENRAIEMRRNIQRILEARVGPGNAIVEVNVESVTERESIVEHTFDPKNRVAISSDTEERSTTSSGKQGGSVTVASNVPNGQAAAGDNTSNSANSETRSRVNYEVSETTREVVRVPGAIKRISVAVLVDGLRTVDPATNTETWAVRSDPEMAALRELVASAVGFDAERGDTITLKTMEFKPGILEAVATDSSLLSRVAFDLTTLIQMVVLALVALILGLFVVRPILASGHPDSSVALALQDAKTKSLPRNAARTLPDGSREGNKSSRQVADALNGEIDDGLVPLPQMALVSAEEMGGGQDLLPAKTVPGSDPVERLRKLIEERREETVEILRSWMEDREEKA